jgi:putative membrane protein
VKFVLRWVANSLCFFLALYLLDSLAAPRFYVQAVWAAVVLAVFLALLNSLIRPLHRVKTRPRRAITVVVLVLLVNTLILQIFIWAGAGLSATSVAWVFVAAAFLSVLGGVVNWLIGFRSKERPGDAAREALRERRAQVEAAAREIKASRQRR